MAKSTKKKSTKDLESKAEVKGGIAPLPSPMPVPPMVSSTAARGIIVVCKPGEQKGFDPGPVSNKKK